MLFRSRPDERPSWADIDVSRKGTLTLRITYTQFNTKTSGGWEKTIDVEVPVSWYRKVPSQSGQPNLVFPQNGTQSIRPGEENEFSSRQR